MITDELTVFNKIYSSKPNLDTLNQIAGGLYIPDRSIDTSELSSIKTGIGYYCDFSEIDKVFVIYTGTQGGSVRTLEGEEKENLPKSPEEIEQQEKEKTLNDPVINNPQMSGMSIDR